jgi:hypothetical protein
MKHQRLILGILLLFLLLSLLMYYSMEHNHHNPEPQYILDHYEDFINTKVVLSGEITNVDRTNRTLLVQVTSSSDGIIQVTTTESLTQTHPGDVIEMYGTLTSNNQMNAESLLIFPQWKNTLIYLRSLLAIPLVLYLFIQAYRFNTDTLRFERRKQDG